VQSMINWFEIPVHDINRAEKFFNTIYGFSMIAMDMEGIEMRMFRAEEISGAIIRQEGMEPGCGGPMIYLNGGEDLNDVICKIEEAGGKIITPKTEISDNHGFFAIFLDTEGNKLGIHSMK